MQLVRKVEVHAEGVIALPRREQTQLRPGDWHYDHIGHIQVFNGELWIQHDEEKPSLDDLESKLLLMKEARDVERALDLCRRAVIPEHETRILSIRAEGVAETERSIYLPLTIAESMAVFEMVSQQLAQRLEALKQKLGVI